MLLFKQINFLEQIIVPILVGLIALLAILNTYHWKQRSKNFKITSRIISIPIIVGIWITAICTTSPELFMNHLRKPILVRIARAYMFNNIATIFLIFSFIILMIIGFYNIDALCNHDYYGSHPWQKGVPIIKQAPHLLYTIIVGCLLVPIIIGLCRPRLSEVNSITTFTYHYHISKVYRHHINHLRPKTEFQKRAKWDVQHFKGRHINKYLP